MTRFRYVSIRAAVRLAAPAASMTAVNPSRVAGCRESEGTIAAVPSTTATVAAANSGSPLKPLRGRTATGAATAFRLSGDTSFAPAAKVSFPP